MGERSGRSWRQGRNWRQGRRGSGRSSSNYISMSDDVEEGGNTSRQQVKHMRNLAKQESEKSPREGREESFRDEFQKSEEEEEVYILRQNIACCSILFSIVQTAILGVMMWKCGIAPMNINPMVGPYPDALSEWGGKNSVLILDDGEWWRLLTPILLHAGVIHLLGNVAVQLETGALFEKEWGSIRWLIIYLTSAVLSTALSVIVMPDAISVGSSGAVMGLFGGKLAEVVLRACERVRTEQERIGMEVRKEQCVGVTCSVIVVMLFSFIPYVDWAAHIGGVIAGLVVGMVVFAFDIKDSILWRVLWLIIGTVVTVITFSLTLSYMYSGLVDPTEDLRDVCGYYREFFDDYECQCMREGGDGGGSGDN